MKKSLLRIASVSLAISLAVSSLVLAETGLPSIYDKNKKKAVPVQEEERKGIKYTPMADNGIPVVITSKRDNQTHELIYSYSGKKRISGGFITPGVSLRAESDNPMLLAWVGDNSVTFENNGLRQGESANVTVTATHKDFEPVVQTIKISITNGTTAYPHIVASKEDLALINELGTGLCYKQTGDIDLAGVRDWTVIGDDIQPFMGKYDGGGFKIKNMAFTTISSQYPALFGVVYGKSSRIEGIKLEGRIDSALYPTNWHGTVVGLLDGGTVADCSFTGDMKLGAGKMLAGGIAADVVNAGTVKNCSVTGKISSKSRDGHIGGISGTLEGNIENCTFTGKIDNEGENTNVGGITGYNFGAIRDSVVKGDLGGYGKDANLGGIAGESSSGIQNCAYMGTLYIKGNQNAAGGISGQNYGQILNCAVKGSVQVTGERAVAGGLAGRNQGGTIGTSSAEVNITGDCFNVYAGGIAGENYSVIDWNNAGRAGASVSTITSCSFTGDIRLKGDLNMAGGAAGRNFGLTAASGGKDENAKSLIENAVIRAGVIEAAKAGRITAESARTTSIKASELVHSVFLKDNAALDTTLVNGAAIDESSTGSGINGQGLGAGELYEFEQKTNEKPTALAFIE